MSVHAPLGCVPQLLHPAIVIEAWPRQDSEGGPLHVEHRQFEGMEAMQALKQMEVGCSPFRVHPDPDRGCLLMLFRTDLWGRFSSLRIQRKQNSVSLVSVSRGRERV